MVATLLIQCTCCGGERDFTATGLPEELNLADFAQEFTSRLQCSECGSFELHTECESRRCVSQLRAPSLRGAKRREAIAIDCLLTMEHAK